MTTLDPTQPEYWQAKRLERRRRACRTRPLLDMTDPLVLAYVWHVIPAAVGRAVTDPINAERYRLVDYILHRTGADVSLMRGLLQLDLLGLRLALVDAQESDGPTMRDKRRAAEAVRRASRTERDPETGDVTQDFIAKRGVLHRVEHYTRTPHPDSKESVTRTTVHRPVHTSWVVWQGQRWRTRSIKRAIAFPWHRSDDGRVLTVEEVRTRVNPYGAVTGGGRSYGQENDT